MDQFIHIILHLNIYLGQLMSTYGLWTFAILFLIIFCETGLVITPFLPGDSLLFACGTLFASSNLNLGLLIGLLSLAAFLGDNSNYWLGRLIGPKVFKEHSKLFKYQYLMLAKLFYQTHGGKAIVIARFLPILRTFIPFVAGISCMPYLRYIGFCLTSALLWVGLLTGLGFWFGNISFIKNNFSAAIFGIIIVSLLPAIIGALRHKFKKQ